MSHMLSFERLLEALHTQGTALVTQGAVLVNLTQAWASAMPPQPPLMAVATTMPDVATMPDASHDAVAPVTPPPAARVAAPVPPGTAHVAEPMPEANQPPVPWVRPADAVFPVQLIDCTRKDNYGIQLPVSRLRQRGLQLLAVAAVTHHGALTTDAIKTVIARELGLDDRQRETLLKGMPNVLSRAAKDGKGKGMIEGATQHGRKVWEVTATGLAWLNKEVPGFFREG